MSSTYASISLRKYDPALADDVCMILDHRMPRLALYFKRAGASRERVTPPPALCLYTATLDDKTGAVTAHRQHTLGMGPFYFERTFYEIAYAGKLIFRIMPMSTHDGQQRMVFGELAEPAPFTPLL